MNVNPKTATPGTKFSREKIPSVPINFFCINESKISITTGSPKPKSIFKRSLNISLRFRSAKAVAIISPPPHLQMKETHPLANFLQFLFLYLQTSSHPDFFPYACCPCDLPTQHATP